MKAYIVLAWDQGEQHPTGEAFFDEEAAIAHVKSDEWLEYDEIDVDMGPLKVKLDTLLTKYDTVMSEGAAKVIMNQIKETINDL